MAFPLARPTTPRSANKAPPPSRRMLPPTGSALHRVGESFLNIAETVGAMGVLYYRIASRIVTLRMDGAELKRNLYKMGVKSIPLVIVTALFTGAIMVVQAAPVVERLDA